MDETVRDTGAPEGFRSGFVSIVGRPNAGKSTFLNAVLGEKVSIVSSKPQTTRNTVRGVKTLPGCQVVFVDTPGIHRHGGLLNEFMVREAMGAISDVDAVILMVEGHRPVSDDDRFIIEGLSRGSAPVILAVNKVDRVEKPALLPLMEEYSKLFDFAEVVPISALTGDGVEALLDVVSSLMPEGPMYFPEDMVTDQPERVIASEMVREKVFENTRQEIPYSVAVVTEEFKEEEDIVRISCAINVERESQKGIIIGRKGAMLKRIGTEARHDLEAFLGTKVFLKLFVRVQKDWTRRPRDLKEFGY